LHADDFDTAHASTEDTEGIIDHLRSVRGTEVAALFSEKHQEIRVSLRSRGKVNVAKLAAAFHGGGHAKAAGITLEGPMDTAVDTVLAAIEAALD
jgi:phosphoesterase RecJ-like protein